MIKQLFRYLNQENDELIISYKALRRLIGILGILLPFINVLGGCLIARIPVQQSISIYYYTNMRDFFVGLMFVVSLFLITYKGYSLIDLIITSITGIAGLGIALFPCFNEHYEAQRVGIFLLYPKTSNVIHLTSAALFFILLAINSIFLFTRTKSEQVTLQKKVRNIIYISCGVTILLCLLVILISFVSLTKEQLYETKIILILESISLLAFGISWLIKGETLFTDK